VPSKSRDNGYPARHNYIYQKVPPPQGGKMIENKGRNVEIDENDLDDLAGGTGEGLV
jgi:hypothetical protein